MRSISDTIARLAKQRSASSSTQTFSHRLSDLGSCGLNPGGLEAKLHIPADLPAQSALVVVLHGCTQSAASYDLGAGWSKLADDYGFAVLFPQQTRANNANLCFNWFVPDDIKRDHGEVLSMREMIETTISQHKLDRRRVFVTGLSAGGAMANALLATYPEVFAGGAIIAGLPYGTAATVPEAFDRMRGHGLPSVSDLHARLCAASKHTGSWPTISVWHGTSDTTVVHGNALAIIDQWRGVHAVDRKADETERVDGHTRQAWRNADGQQVIEHFSISGMGHGTPLDVSAGYGQSGPYMLDVGISSTVHIARGWGLVASFEKRANVGTTATHCPRSSVDTTPSAASGGILKTIEDALRSAGLMK